MSKRSWKDIGHYHKWFANGDLIEEIGRLYGFDRIPVQLPDMIPRIKENEKTKQGVTGAGGFADHPLAGNGTYMCGWFFAGGLLCCSLRNHHAIHRDYSTY